MRYGRKRVKRKSVVARQSLLKRALKVKLTSYEVGDLTPMCEEEEKKFLPRKASAFDVENYFITHDEILGFVRKDKIDEWLRELARMQSKMVAFDKAAKHFSKAAAFWATPAWVQKTKITGQKATQIFIDDLVNYPLTPAPERTISRLHEWFTKNLHGKQEKLYEPR